jgi:hypothetical protein
MKSLLITATRTSILLLFIALWGHSMGSEQVWSQDVFEGKVVYQMSGEDHPGQSVLTYYIRPEAMRLEMDMTAKPNKRNKNNQAPGQSGIMIFRDQTVYMLMPDQKMYMELPMNNQYYDYDAVTEEEWNTDIKMARTGEMRTILGYEAEKFVFEDKEEDYRTVAWLTSELGAFIPMQSSGRQGGKRTNDRFMWQSQIEGVGLFPLEVLVYDTKGQLSTKMTAQEVTPMSIEEEQGSIPSGYTKMGLGSLFQRQQN